MTNPSTLADTGHPCFAYIDRGERFVFVNAAFAKLAGHPAESITGERVEAVLGPSAYAKARPHFDRAFAGAHAEYEAVSTSGQSGSSLHVILVPRHEGGKVVGVFVVGIDVTRERNEASALEESRDRLASVLATATEAIVTIDEDARIDSFNPAAETMFGYSAEEAIGQSVSLLMPEPYRSEHDGYIERYVRTREERIIGKGREVVARRKDGSTFPVDLNVSEIDGQRGFTGIIRDMTASKRAAAALERSREELRSLSARLLTAEEAERRRISRELHDDVNQRLAMLSVDLETLYQEHAADDALSSRLVELRRRVETLSEDVHGMAYRLHPSILDDLGVEAAVRTLCRDFTVRHGLSVAFSVRNFPTRVTMDLASCLYRVVQESLSNAARHSQSPRVAIRLAASGAALRLTVRDYGVGFDVEAARDHRTSLGIVSMEERVRMAGGEFGIHSSPRSGTVIRVTCPLALSDAEP